MNPEEYSYSFDGERYSEGYPTEQAAADAAFKEDPTQKSCVVGRLEPPTAPEFLIDADLLIEHVQCQDSYNHDAAEGWPDAAPSEYLELTDAVRKVFAEWLDKHGLRPDFQTVAGDKLFKNPSLTPE